MTALVVGLEGWELGEQADRRFWRTVALVGLPALLFAILLPYFDLSGLKAGGGDTGEQRYVSLVPDAKPAEQTEEPAPAPEDEPEPEEAKKPEKVEPKKPVVEQVTPPQPTEAEVKAQARAKAQRSGVLAMADQLAALREQSLQGLDTARPLSDLVAAKSGTGASGGALSPDFAQSAAASSGGIGSTGTAAERRSQSGAGLGQRRTTAVESPVGFGEDKSKQGDNGDKLVAGRTISEIQQIFDRNKGALLAIINRALRENPNLQGVLTIAFTVNPDGSVADLRVVGGSVGDPDVDQKLLARIRLINFGAKAVPPYKLASYPLHLF